MTRRVAMNLVNEYCASRSDQFNVVQRTNGAQMSRRHTTTLASSHTTENWSHPPVTVYWPCLVWVWSRRPDAHDADVTYAMHNASKLPMRSLRHHFMPWLKIILSGILDRALVLYKHVLDVVRVRPQNVPHGRPCSTLSRPFPSRHRTLC